MSVKPINQISLPERRQKQFLLGLGCFTMMMFSGCANPGIVQVSANTYILSREDHAGIFGSASRLKAGVIRDANAFAAKQGKVAVPISAKEHQMGVMADWASFEYQFKLLAKDDPESKNKSVPIDVSPPTRTMHFYQTVPPLVGLNTGTVGGNHSGGYPITGDSVVETQIDGEFKGWSGEDIWKMTNGQIWQQARYGYHYHYAYRPSVLIYHTSGGWKMKVENDEEIEVKQLR
jgi:hypothetical protein